MGEPLDVGDPNRRHPGLVPSGMSLADEMQMNQYAIAHRMSMDSMIANGGLALGPQLMIPMDMVGDGPMHMDPQMGGDHFAALAQGAPMAAGGIPGDYGTMSSGSILTEFTKRRNWSQRILEELQDFLHILTPTGKIVYASPSCQTLTGFDPSDLINKVITEYIHQDDSALWVSVRI